MVIVTFLHLLERASSYAPFVCPCIDKGPCKMAVVSPGLLVTVPKRSKDAHRRFELGLGEWTESSEDEKENDPPAPRNKLAGKAEGTVAFSDRSSRKRSSAKVRCKEHF